ncbi:YtcA family lipoprotein [Pseudochelatococcus sp. G4_1912]|uniref:YtcA family lipoprotein n=1 Tax=Pseudochelatococcus sp. G4_1912 TaxID=3114288 RepID=UPI0039C70E0C
MHQVVFSRWFAVFSSLAVAGCSSQPSPSFPLFGAYFPSWLAYLAVGIVGALVVRLIFVRTGVDDQMPFRLVVYISLAAGIAFALALLIYGR